MDRQECLSHREALDFGDDAFRREAAALAADEGDDTVGAAKIAAVLDFESWAGVVGFAAEDGSGEELGTVEDVADKDVAKMGRSMLRPYKGMKRNGRVRVQRGDWEKAGRGTRR